MSIRLRLIVVAAAIVAVSLVISGLLTGVLVRQLELQNAQIRLDQDVTIYRTQILNRECASLQSAPSGACANLGTLRGIATAEDFTVRIDDLRGQLAGARLLLVASNGRVVYDSEGKLVNAVLPNPSAARARAITRDAVISEVDLVGGGTDYVAAAAPLSAARDPLGAAWIVLAQPRSSITQTATGQLVPLLLIAGGVSLAIALVLVLLVSRALVRPLTELAAAAEDIGRGNYARRVGIDGNDEIGITARAFNRMAAAVETSRQAQREFLANASHELKTPLTSLIGFSQALVDGSLPDEQSQRRAAQIVHEESERVLRMARELLDLARVESGHIALNPQPVDLLAMLRQEVDVLGRRAEEKSLRLRLEVPPDLPPGLADPERLHQVLDNLLDNAVKYAPRATSVLVSAFVAGDPGGQAVEVQVSNPVGDHRPDPERMFDRFYRADPSRSSAAGGVGLGLAISQELATAMKGRLWADFDRSGWLRLRLQLPRAAPPAGSDAGPAAARARRPAA